MRTERRVTLALAWARDHRDSDLVFALLVAEFKQHMRAHLALCVARERGTETEEAVTRSQVFLTQYATNELREFHEAHFQQVN